MKIIRIVLETVNIERMKKFYIDMLEMPIIRTRENMFTVRAGTTHITFQKSNTDEAPLYHFALRTNLEFYEYMLTKLIKNNVHLLPNSDGQVSGYWKGKQVYFNDPDGNIVEILERKFPSDQVVTGWQDICEVGIPIRNMEDMNTFFSLIPNVNDAESGTFRFYGDEVGNFVLVKEGRNWYPTERPATIHPMTIEVEGDQYRVLKHSELPYTVKVKKPWTETFPVVQMRIARPTDKFEQVIDFYESGLGLQRVGEFLNHEGYDGVMFGLPDMNYHLEFTRHISGTPCPAPTKDNLFVFYLPNWETVTQVANRLQNRGYPAMTAENPYWGDDSITIEDPDGWRIVLYCSTGL